MADPIPPLPGENDHDVSLVVSVTDVCALDFQGPFFEPCRRRDLMFEMLKRFILFLVRDY